MFCGFGWMPNWVYCFWIYGKVVKRDSWLNVIFLGSSLGSFVANWTCMVFKTKTNKIFSAATGNLQLLELNMRYHPCFLQRA
ncbi:unnamed protein product [Lathyrus sativus]|nr:unnamed protein product [Lathyrus sativus]